MRRDRRHNQRTTLQKRIGELRAHSLTSHCIQQGIDTATPAGKRVFQTLEAFTEFERSMIVERPRPCKTLAFRRVGLQY
jgi:DNA invertase Pin-like site-specific DNA recombinase